MTIDIIKRLNCRLNGRSLLSAHEQMLADCHDEITKLREEKKNLVDKVINIINDFKPYSPYVVGKLKIEARKVELIEQIKTLV